VTNSEACASVDPKVKALDEFVIGPVQGKLTYGVNSALSKYNLGTPEFWVADQVATYTYHLLIIGVNNAVLLFTTPPVQGVNAILLLVVVKICNGDKLPSFLQKLVMLDGTILLLKITKAENEVNPSTISTSPKSTQSPPSKDKKSDWYCGEPDPAPKVPLYLFGFTIFRTDFPPPSFISQHPISPVDEECDQFTEEPRGGFIIIDFFLLMIIFSIAHEVYVTPVHHFA
jgi:hypothetical protein